MIQQRLSKQINLEHLQQKLVEWRRGKSRRVVQIPDELYKELHTAACCFGYSKVQKITGVQRGQIEAFEKRQEKASSDTLPAFSKIAMSALQPQPTETLVAELSFGAMQLKIMGSDLDSIMSSFCRHARSFI